MEASDSPLKQPRRKWQFWFGIGLSLIAVVWLITTTDWPTTWQALIGADYWLILLAAGLNLLTIPMRTARWRLLFHKDNLPGFGRLTAVMLIGQSINMMVPGRAGDLVRAALVGTERTTYVLGTLMVFSSLDLLMLAGLVAVLLFQVNLPAWWRGSGEALLVSTTAILLAALLLILARRQLLKYLTQISQRWSRLAGNRLLDMATEFLRSLSMLNNPQTTFMAFLSSILIWFVYGVVNYVLMTGLGMPSSWLAAFFLLAVLQLGIAIPSSPGRIGVYHYLSIQSLAVFGVARGTAVSYAIILHFISVILPTLVGAFLFWRMNRLPGQKE